MFKKQPLQNIIDQSISSDAPCGADIRHATSFAEIKSEVRKMEHHTTHQNVNWSAIAKHSTAVLETESKDILVAVYLLVAWSKIHGAEGLLQALSFLTGLINKYSTELQPKARPKNYASALAWLTTQLQKILQDTFFAHLDKKYLKNLQKEISTLNAAAEKHFQNTYLAALLPNINKRIGLYDETHKIEQKKEQLTEQISEAKQAEVTAEKPVEAKREQVEVDIRTHLLEKANQLLQEDYHDVRAYIFSRTAIWGELIELPECDQNFETHIAFPNKVTELDIQHVKEQNFCKEKILALEAYCQRYPFWLDLHHCLYNSFANQSDYQAVLSVLKLYLVLLQERFPKISQLKFSNGERCCSMEAKKWLANLVNLHTTEKCTIPSDTKAEGDDQTLSALIDKVGPQSNAKERKELLQHLKNKMNTTRSARERVVALMTLSECLLQFNDLEFVPVYLQELQACLQKYQIIEWEPGLAIRILSLLYKANTELGERANDEQKHFSLAKLMILDDKLYQKLTK